jgi:hypothetical protein
MHIEQNTAFISWKASFYIFWSLNHCHNFSLHANCIKHFLCLKLTQDISVLLVNNNYVQFQVQQVLILPCMFHIH